jgi:hypothetical protein
MASLRAAGAWRPTYQTPAALSLEPAGALAAKAVVTEPPRNQEEIIGTATIAVFGLLPHTNSGSSKPIALLVASQWESFGMMN